MFGWIKTWRRKEAENKEHRKERKKDLALQKTIETEIQQNEYLQDHKISVDVQDGIVTLEGLVTSPLKQDLVEEILQDIPGIQEIRNNIDLGIGRPGEEKPLDTSSDELSASEASNTNVPNLHHPSTTAFSEVKSQSREELTGGTDTGITADESMQTPILTGGEGSSVMDAGAVDAIRVSGDEIGDDDLANVLKEGVKVLDRDRHQVGVVKTVRSTDFLLDRPMARDVYVPYFACKYDGKVVTLNVLSDEINDQGWHMPILF